jgi:adenylylsulfate kinase
VTFVSKLLTRNGVIVLTSFISPYAEMRDNARRQIGEFLEVFVKCPLDVCIERDVKGMYKKAIAGQIKEFTGISDPYEEPVKPELVIETDKESLAQSTDRLLQALKDRGYLD